jgi:hypothetical protein
VGEAEKAIRLRERAVARDARRSYRRHQEVKSEKQEQEEAEHWRRWAELEPLVPQAIEALRKAGWPNPDRIIKVGPFRVRRAAWTLATSTHYWGENYYGAGGSATSPSVSLLSDGRFAFGMNLVEVRAYKLDLYWTKSSEPVSYWREPTRCMSPDYDQMVRSLRSLIALSPRR